MEFLEGGELFQKIKNQGAFSEMEAANLIRQVASAIEYCHGLGIVHRDLVCFLQTLSSFSFRNLRIFCFRQWKSLF
jgi:serine/threonine protein kinase